MSKTPPSGSVNGENPTTEHTDQPPTQYLVCGVDSPAPTIQLDNENCTYAQPVSTNMTPNSPPRLKLLILHVIRSPKGTTFPESLIWNINLMMGITVMMRSAPSNMLLILRVSRILR